MIAAKAKLAPAMHEALKDTDTYNVIVGKPNTADAIKIRINKIIEIFGDNIR